jgi:superfamily II DNA or RNA helicase
VIIVLKGRLSKVIIKSAWSELQQLWNEFKETGETVHTCRPIVNTKRAAKAKGSSSDTMQGGFLDFWKTTGTQAFNRKVLVIWAREALDAKSTVVFCANLDMVDNLVKQFKEAGIDAKSISSRTPPQQQSQIIREFKELRLSVLINCEILTEGADMPSVLSPTKFMKTS